MRKRQKSQVSRCHKSQWREIFRVETHTFRDLDRYFSHHRSRKSIVHGFHLYILPIFFEIKQRYVLVLKLDGNYNWLKKKFKWNTLHISMYLHRLYTKYKWAYRRRYRFNSSAMFFYSIHLLQRCLVLLSSNVCQNFRFQQF